MSAASSLLGYVSPWPNTVGITTERIDQGLDFSAQPGTKIRAIGKAKVEGIIPNWYQGQPYVFYRLLEGPDAGKLIYNAEQLTPDVKPGEIVNAGQTIGTVASSGSGLEFGFAAPGGATLAQATTGYHEGEATAAGKAFASFYASLPEGEEVAPGLFAKGAKGIEEGGKAAGEGVTSAAQAAATPIVEGVAGIIKPVAIKLLLYAVFIIGVIALAGYGFATMVKPTPPDLRKGTKRAGELLAGLAAAA